MSRAFCLFALVCCKRRVLKRLGQRLRWNKEAPFASRRFNNRVRPATQATSLALSSASRSTRSNWGGVFQRSKKLFRFTNASPGNGKGTTGTQSSEESSSTKNTCTSSTSGEVVYAVPKCNSRVEKQTMDYSNFSIAKSSPLNSPNKKVNFSSIRQNSTSCLMKEPESPLELGDLSNSAANSPFAKTFPEIVSRDPAERRTSDIDREHSDKISARKFSRSSSKVMNNPIFEASSDPSNIENGASDVTTEATCDLPEMSVVDDDIPITSWDIIENEFPDNPSHENRTVSVTSL